jgi:cytochrome c biogenesis protein CcmG, thiol:disulfide interchange protein DsbE
MTQRQQWGIVAAVVVLLAVVLGAGVHFLGDELFPVSVGSQAPPIHGVTLDSAKREKSLADYKGKVVLLNVWASWCEPCKRESPLLERWHRRMKDQGGTVLGVDTLDIKDDALGFISKYNLTYPQLNDREGTAIKKLGTAQYPESFVVDRAGRITAVQRGPVDEAWMRRHVAPLLTAA